ncbi:winged helix-turn-helix transcriptional regulator [Nocardioides plantarum]|uniref:Winged-helix domain-containing protein n=1 Tax=Nocardioides plantarum TaxID=29299 RepID=A0ABV5K7H1_9ACTN|nr:response regulator transcription factor [Nocardioides plantarum]
MPQLRLAVIAEDDADVRDLIHLVLSQSGFTVVLAKDGPEAIAAVQEHQPLLTTLDVNMPGMDGFAVAKTLRQFSRTYLIMITSLTSEVDIIRGFEAGADDYLVKPFRPRELRARADSMLRRAAYAEPEAGSAPSVPRPEPGLVPDPEPEVSSWAASAAQELRDASGTPTPYVGRRVRPVDAEPPPPAQQPVQPAQQPIQPVQQVPQTYQPAEPAQPQYQQPIQQQPVQQPVQQQPVQPAVVPVSSAASHDAIAHEPIAPGHVLRFADLVVDTTNGVAAIGGRALPLTQPEAEILLSLLRTGRRVRSKADLVLAVRGQQYVTSYFVNEADKKAIDGHVASLRRKLNDDGPTPRYIETVKGVGFRMADG